MQRRAFCRSRRELSNAYLLAKFGFDTAENEPFQVCPLSAYRSPRYGLAQEAGGEVAKANRGKRRRSKQNKHGRLLLTSGILGDRTAAEASTAADGWDALICEPPPKVSASNPDVSQIHNLTYYTNVI